MLKIRRVLYLKWQHLSTGSANRQIFGAVVIVAFLTFGVKLLSLFKEIAVSAAFGTGSEVDAFLIAFLLPSFMISIVVQPLNSAFIPVYLERRTQKDHQAAQRLLSETVTLSAGLLLLLTLTLSLVGSYLLPVLASGFKPEKLALTQTLFYLLLPTMLLSGMAILWTSVLNSEEHFGLAAIAPSLVSLAPIVTLFLFKPILGIFGLAVGTGLGFFLQVCLLGYALRRYGIHLQLCWPGKDPAVRQIIHQYWPITIGSVLLGSTGLVDQAIGAAIAPGSVAALSYGNRLISLITSVGAVALATAVFPYLAKMAAVADWVGLRHTLGTYSRLILLITIPITILLYVFSESLTQIIFQRGAFNAEDTQLVSQIQTMYILQIPFYTLGLLFSRLISSLQANHILMWGALIGCILNVGLDYLLLQFMGVAGIALSTTLVYVASLAFLATMAYRILPDSKTDPITAPDSWLG